MFNEIDEARIGIVVRDSSGQVLAAMVEKNRKPYNVESLDMIAAKRAVIFSSEIGQQQCQFESDSEIGIKALQMGDMFSSSFLSLDGICSVRYRCFYFYGFFSFLIIFSGLVLFLKKKKKKTLDL